MLRNKVMNATQQSNDDIIQFDYLPEEKTIKINLPKQIIENINTIIITKHFKDEIVIEKRT